MNGFLKLPAVQSTDETTGELGSVFFDFIRPAFAQAFARCWILVASGFYLWDLLRHTRVGLTDGAGQPFGGDFLNYWSGAFLAWHGAVTEVYDWQGYHAFQESVAGGSLDFYHYSYPPVLLLLTAPLAALPYIPALIVWTTSSWFCFYRALRLALPGSSVLLFSIAVPAVFINVLGGQNGAWTAALFGGGLCLLNRRPITAGILLGLLIYKPQFGVLLPVALLAGRQWKALTSAAVTAVGLVLISGLIFGLEIWTHYFHNLTVLRQAILEDGSGVWHRMVSVFVFARRLGADVETAYLAQAVMALLAAAVVAYVWSRDTPAGVRNAVLVLGTCLATPYLQDYDLVVGAFVPVWLAVDASHSTAGKQAAQLSLLVLLLPFVASLLAKLTGLALGPVFVVPAFLAATRLSMDKQSCPPLPPPACPVPSGGIGGSRSAP
jgi:arabinofuranan 3-O-arabinosyltransferase